MTANVNQINDRDNYITMLEYLICTDIKDLLGEFKKPKNGLKKILVKRAKELLDSQDEKVYVKLKELYNDRYKARNGKEPGDEDEKNSENLNGKDSLDKSDSNLADEEENGDSESADNPESMEIETEQNGQESELSLIEIQKRLENLEAIDTPVHQSEKNCQIAANPATDSSNNLVSNNTLNSNLVQNIQDKNNNIQSLEQNLNLNCQRTAVHVLSTMTNLDRLEEQMQVDQNIWKISSNIQSLRQIFNEKFKEMTNYKCCADLEEATMLIPRPKVSFKTVVSLNKLKTEDVDFTTFMLIEGC